MYGYKFKRVGADSLLFIPSDTLRIPTSYNGLSYVAKIGSTLYYWGGTKWLQFVSVIDTTSLSNRIDAKASQSALNDTANNIRSDFPDNIDTSSLSTRINQKADTADLLNIDTSGVQDGYVATWDTSGVDKVVFSAPTGGSDSTWYLNFKIGDTYAPSVGDSLLIHTMFSDKRFTVYRNGLYVNKHYLLNDTTLKILPAFVSADTFAIVIRDSTNTRQLALENHTPPVTVENIDWTAELRAIDGGSGNLTANGSVPAGATATKRLTKATGNYVEFTVDNPILNSETAVLVLDNVADTIYGWVDPPRVTTLSAIYFYGTTYKFQNGDASSGTSTDLTGTTTAGDVVRLEISGDNIIAKINGTTKHTYTGVLSGITNIYIKGLFATGTNKKFINTKGYGLVNL